MDSGSCVAEVAVGGVVLAMGKQVDKVEAGMDGRLEAVCVWIKIFGEAL